MNNNQNLVRLELNSTKHFNTLNFFIFSLFFFPSITFGIISAEIFPWVIILSIFFFKRTTSHFLLILGFLVINSIITLLTNPSIYFEVIRSLASYLNSLIAFAFALSITYEKNLKFIKLSKIIFFILIILGFLQFFNLIEFLDPFIKFLVPRGSSTTLFEINRGVTLLSSEPARAGILLTCLYFLMRYVYINKKYRLLFDISMTLYLLLIIQSSMSLLFMLTFLFINYRLKFIFFISAILFILITFSLSFSGGRVIELFSDILKTNNLSDIFFIIVNNSGHRLISIYSSYYYSIINPLGGGIGNWMISSVESLSNTGFDLYQFNYFKEESLMMKGFTNFDPNSVPIRSSGFFSNLALDSGIVGIFIVFKYVWDSLKKFWHISRESKNLILIFFFKILFIGSVGHPVAWLIIVFILRFLYENQLNQSRQENKLPMVAK